MLRSCFLAAIMLNVALVASAEPVSAQTLVGDWVLTGPPYTNRVVFQKNGTGTILYGVGNYESFRWTANSNGTITFRNRSLWSSFNYVRSLPDRSVSVRITNKGVMHLFNRTYRKM